MQQEEKGTMPVSEAGHRGGQKVKKLVEEGKEMESERTTSLGDENTTNWMDEDDEDEDENE